MKEDGLYIISDPDKDRPEEERKTFRCCHCGGHFSPGDKYKNVVRDLLLAGAGPSELMKACGHGYCARCDEAYCGKRECHPDRMNPHVHFMEQIEAVEDSYYRICQSNLFLPSQLTIGGDDDSQDSP